MRCIPAPEDFEVVTIVDFVPVPERFATFDDDGTLWGKKPIHFQLFFVIDLMKALVPQQRARKQELVR